MAPNVGNTADPQTAQEKYDALVEAGIFEGFPDGQAHLDQNMTRAQAAKIVALVLGLEQDASAASVYKDLKDAEWAAGYIGAATEAGILNGRGNGIFDPSSNVTFQELAKIMVEALDLDVDEGATVEGASDWAKAYVAAAVAAGLIPAQTDYTAPASREILVAASYVAQETIQANQNAEGNEDEENEEKDAEKPVTDPIVYNPLSISEFRQVDAREFSVRFNQYVDPATVRLSVTKDGNPVDAQAVSVGNNQYLINFNENVQDVQYIVDARYADSSTVFTSARVSGSAERLVKLEFTANTDTVAHSNRTGIEILASNQFGKSMRTPPQLEVFSAVPAEMDDKHMAAILDTSSLQQSQGTIAVAVFDQAAGISVTKVFNVGTAANAANAKFIGSLRNGEGNEVTEAVWGNSYHANFNLYDQYGHLMFSTSTSPSFTHSPSSEFITIGSYANAPSSEPGTFSVPVTLSSSSTEQKRNYELTLSAGESTNRLTYTVAAALPKLGTPTADPTGGDIASGTQVSLSATIGATIYYTTNGADPKTNGTAYSTPIEVTQAMTIKAIAVKNGMRDSDILSVSYTILNTYSPLDLINYEAEHGLLMGFETEVTAQTFVDAGITGVTSDNLYFIRYYIVGSDKPYPLSKADLQDIVNQYLADNEPTAFGTILAYFEDDTGPVPTLEDFEDAGLEIEDESLFDDLLQYLVDQYKEFRNSQGMFGSPMDSVESVQDAIDYYFENYAY